MIFVLNFTDVVYEFFKLRPVLNAIYIFDSTEIDSSRI